MKQNFFKKNKKILLYSFNKERNLYLFNCKLI